MDEHDSKDTAGRGAWAIDTDEHRNRILVESTHGVPYLAAPDGSLLYLGEQFVRYGYSAQDVVERGIMELIVPEDRERVAAELARTMTTGEELPRTFRIRTRDGEIRWLEDRGTVRRDAEGNIVGLVGVLRDITDRRRAEEALRRSEARFRLLAEQSLDMVFVLDATRREFQYVSPAVERITGYRPEELVGRPLGSTPISVDASHVKNALAGINETGTLEGFQFSLTHKNGSRVYAEINAAYMEREGKPPVIQGIMRDLTPRRALEEQLRQVQKMEAIGTLAGGIAHDFNNLLTGILGAASLLKRPGLPPERVTSAADVIERSAERAAQLTQQLLGFARRGKLEMVTVDLHQVVEDVLSLLSRTLNRQIVIERKLHAESALVSGDPGQLQQVILNLVVNAADAMPEGGLLRLETDVVPGDGAVFDEPPQCAPCPCVRLRVSDTGPGVPEEVQARIFEPFFTTKDDLGRTGLGLATAYGVVTNHSGALRLSSASGGGATFEVILPLATSSRDPDEGCFEPAIRGRGLVLVIDDEEVVRDLAKVLLAELGYDVITATTGDEGLSVYRERGPEVELVLLDLVMPGMSGAECFRRLRQLDADARVLLSTGHAVGDEAQALLEAGALGVLHKPYTLRQMSRTLAELVTESACGE